MDHATCAAAPVGAPAPHPEVYGLLLQLRGEFAAVAGEVAHIRKAIGTENDAGDGGQGIVGRVARMERDVRGLVVIKQRALGAVAAVSLFGALILAGAKVWLVGSSHG